MARRPSYSGLDLHGRWWMGLDDRRGPSVRAIGGRNHSGGDGARNTLYFRESCAWRPNWLPRVSAGRHVYLSLFALLRERRLESEQVLSSRDELQSSLASGERCGRRFKKVAAACTVLPSAGGGRAGAQRGEKSGRRSGDRTSVL